MSHPTEKEIEILPEFRERIKDLIKDNEDLKNEMHLLRWLRARELDISKAEDMLRNSLTWRKDHDMENYESWIPPKNFKKDFSYEVWGFDEEGSLTGLLPFGNWLVRENAVENGNKENYVKHIHVLVEYIMKGLRWKSKEIGHTVTQFNIIFDLKGYSYRQLASFSTVDTVLLSLKNFEANQPETLKSAYIINAPKVFSILFSLIKPLLTARTFSKVQIYDSSSKWQKNFNSGLIPISYGGSNAHVCTDFKEYFENWNKYKNLPELSITRSNEDKNIEFKEIILEASETVNMELEVLKPKIKIGWEFETKDNDIGFELKVKCDKSKEKIVDYVRTTNDAGEYLCNRPGKYVLTFDNSYSYIKSKRIIYKYYILKDSE